MVLAQLIKKNNIMTLYQLFKRFLKDNELYGYYFNSVFKGYDGRLSKKKFTNKDVFNRWVCRRPMEAIMQAFSFDAHFAGASYSEKRKKLYSLNKRWKYFLKKHVFIQTNIEVNDIFYGANGVEYKIIRFITPFLADTEMQAEGHYHFSANVYSMKNMKNKDHVFNLYIKDNKGRCYGKIDGDYNEIQLQ